MVQINKTVLRSVVDKLYKIPANRNLTLRKFVTEVQKEDAVRAFRFNEGIMDAVGEMLDLINKGTDIIVPKLRKMGNPKTNVEIHDAAVSILKTNQGYSYLELRQGLVGAGFILSEEEARDLYYKVVDELTSAVTEIKKPEKRATVKEQVAVQEQPKKVVTPDYYKTVEELVGQMPEKPKETVSMITPTQEEIIESILANIGEMKRLKQELVDLKAYDVKLTKRLETVEKNYSDRLKSDTNDSQHRVEMESSKSISDRSLNDKGTDH